jgi:hypothetical protein
LGQRFSRVLLEDEHFSPAKAIQQLLAKDVEVRGTPSMEAHFLTAVMAVQPLMDMVLCRSGLSLI